VHGSSVTTRVPPFAFSAAARNATTSAWASPNSACHPSPTTSLSFSTTAPTSGLGDTRPHPRRPSSIARCIALRSNASLAKTHGPTPLARSPHPLIPSPFGRGETITLLSCPLSRRERGTGGEDKYKDRRIGE